MRVVVFKNGHETLISENEWMNLADFLHANTCSGKVSYFNTYWWVC